MTGKYILAALAFVAVACGAPKGGVPETSRTDDALVEVFNDSVYFNQLYSCARMRYSFDKGTPADFNAWQTEFRAELSEKLGLTRISEQLAGYKPKVVLSEEFEDLGTFTRRRGTIWTEPEMPLPFVLLMPKNIEGRVPLVLALQGHSKNPELFAGIYLTEKDREYGEEGERNVGVQAVEKGFIAIVPTTRAFGETRLPEDKEADLTSSCLTYVKRDLLVGRTPIGDRVWDAMKIIDWALAELPVREDEIIVTGNSGGGTSTLFTGAMDTRVAVSMPASYFCTFRASIGNIKHCPCNYIPGVLDLGEMYDIAGLTAPRYFRAIQGVKDKIFPIEGSREAFSRLQRIYETAGAPEKCSLYEGPEGHRYYKAGAWPFIDEILSVSSSSK